MASVNKVIVIGNLGADPEIRYTPGGQAVCDLRVATTEQWTDKGGEKKEQTEWHHIVVWGKQAENCSQYLSKGRQIYVEGRLQTRQWDDKDGNRRYTTEVVAQSVKFLGGGRGEGAPREGAPRERTGGGGGGGGYSQEPPSQGYESGPGAMADDDLPF